MVIKRFEVWLIQLDPTVGNEVQKMRPCLVISRDVVHKYLGTVTIIPLTSTIKEYPTRINCEFDGRAGQLMIDQIRSVDKSRLKKKIGTFDSLTAQLVCKAVSEIFKY